MRSIIIIIISFLFAGSIFSQQIVLASGVVDVVRPNLSTNLSNYNSASSDEAVVITQVEHDAINAALTNKTEKGAYNTSTSYSTTDSHADEGSSVGGGNYYPLLLSFDIKTASFGTAATQGQVIIRDGTLTGTYTAFGGTFDVPTTKQRIYIIIKNPTIRNGNGYFGYSGISGNVDAPVQVSAATDRAYNSGSPILDLSVQSTGESLSIKSVTTTSKQW